MNFELYKPIDSTKSKSPFNTASSGSVFIESILFFNSSV